MKKIWIAVVAIMTTLSTIAPAQAFPAVSAPQVQTSDVQQVRDNNHNRRFYRGERRHSRDWNRGRGYRHDRHYRGYRNRHHNGAAAIIGGLAAGAIIGGAINSQRSYGGNSHVSWCQNRYRSYRASDNTFQPYNGGRQQCRSPY